MELTGLTIFASDRKGLLRDITTIISAHNANIEFSQSFTQEDEVLIYFEIKDADDISRLIDDLKAVDAVNTVETYRPFEMIYGKRVIVIGGGAQVAEVVKGAVSEADRHNIRGERISVDTIPLVGEKKLAEAIRAVGRLHRAAILVLAGSLMGGSVAEAVTELREDYGVPVISLNMAGTVPDASDVVITDPIQAGVMAVMAIARTASFDIKKARGRKF